MIVDIGGGTTEIAVISLGGIVADSSIKVAGDQFTYEIQQYMRQQHNIKIGEKTAEEIKINIGAAISDLDEPIEPYKVSGPNLMTVLPIETTVTPQEIAHCLDKSLVRIESAIMSVLEQTPRSFIAISYIRASILQVAEPCSEVLTNVCSRKSTFPSTWPRTPQSRGKRYLHCT